MQRVKSFDSTGVAPDGYLYAGDLNAIQDAAAALADLTQNLQAATLAVGESGLMVVRYGAGEARITGALRTDGILRGLGGLYAGQFTSAQRDAIAAGSRPYGIIIVNVDTNRLEWNSGTDASPNWQPVGPTSVEVPVGAAIDWPWAGTGIPSWAILAYGQAISRTTYSALEALASAASFPYGNGDGSSTFNIPDMRGRVTVGKDDMGGTAAGRITAAISGVAGTVLGAVFGAEGIALTTAQLPAHNHSIATYGTFDTATNAAGGKIAGYASASNSGNNATGNNGSGVTHQNTQPSIIVNKILRAL